MKKFITSSFFVLFLALGQVFASGPETPAQRQQILAAAAVQMGMSYADLVAEDEQGNVSIEYVGTDIATGENTYFIALDGWVIAATDLVV